MKRRKLITMLIAIALLISGVCYGGNQEIVVQAATPESGVEANSEGYYVKDYDAGSFNKYKENGTYPKLTSQEDGEDIQEWLFAGWYQNKEDDICSEPYDSTVKTVEAGTTVYAKFVPASVLAVKCQVTPGTDCDSEKTNMRLISTTDSADYTKVGFKVVYKGKTIDCYSSTVYKRVAASNDGMECNYSANAFDTASNYFFAARLTNISNANFSESFYIEPYWVTADGTTVTGVSRYARVEDSYEKIVNLPVRLYSDEQVTSGSVSLSYNATQFDLYAVDGVTKSTGTVFDTVDYVKNVDEETNVATLTLTGTSTEAVTVDGIFANIRLQLKEDQLIESNTTFEVTEEEFSNGDESVTLDVANVVYKNYAMSYEGNPDTSWYDEFADDDTFVISTAADLYGLAKIVNDTTGDYADEQFSDKTIIMGADITINDGTASATDFTMTDEAETRYSWTPIGTSSTQFKGTLNGQGNAISGIYCVVTESENTGLFGYVGSGGEIRELKLHNSYISGNKYVGSIVGTTYGTIDTVYSTAYVTSANGYAGGIVARMQDSDTSDSTATTVCNSWFGGSVTTTSSIGGIAGVVTKGCYCLENCLNTGSVISTQSSANQSAGGIMGHDNGNATTNTIDISNCLVVGTITVKNNTSPTYVGSILGRNRYGGFTITNTYATNESYSVMIGSTNGENGEVGSESSYSAVAASDIKGHTSYSKVKSLGFATSSNLDGIWVARESAEDVANGSPALKAFVDEWIDVAWYYDNKDSSDPLTISTTEELYGFSAISQDVTFSGYNVLLANDISANKGQASSWVAGTTEASREWTPIGNSTNKFAGTFNGQGHAIEGIYCYDAENENNGLFRYVDTGGEIRELELHNSYISGEKYVGSIVGTTYGTIDTVYSTAYVTSANGYAGGIVARMQDSNTSDSTATTVCNCWFGGSVTTTSSTGGITGVVTKGSYCIENCLNTGSVISTTSSNNQSAGGIMGHDNGNATTNTIKISNCLVAGTITVKNNTSPTYVGSILGRNRYGGFTITNTYATNESYSVNNEAILIGSSTNGTNGTVESGTTYSAVSASDINGHTSYSTVKALGFATSSNMDGIWVVRESAEDVANGSPALKVFADEWIDVAWYYDSEPDSDESDTFTISTANELYGFSDIAQDINFSGDTVQLANDIIANKGSATENGWTPDADEGTSREWTPVGNTTLPFAGTFDGADKTISGIYVNWTGTKYAGLFGQVSGTIQNLRFEKSYIYSDARWSGTIVGQLTGNLSGVYSNAHLVTAPNTSTTYEIGGLVGRIAPDSTDTGGTISNCWFDGTITSSTTGTSYKGGIVGRVQAVINTIKDCLNSGTIYSYDSNTAYVGGIVGGVSGASVTCPISDCLDIGNIKAESGSTVGSIIGFVDNKKTAIIEDTYSVTLIGASQCTGVGKIGTTNSSVTGSPRILDETDLQGAKAYYNTDLEFSPVESDGAWIAVEGGTPELAAFSDKTAISNFGSEQKVSLGWYYNGFVYTSGERTNVDTYTIVNAEELFGFAKVVNELGDTLSGDTVLLGADITVSEGTAEKWADGTAEAPTNPWIPIGISADASFQGELDGQGYTISGIYVDKNVDTTYTGLFGYAKSCTISNLRLENSYFSTVNKYAGSIFGYGGGILTNIYSDAILNSTNVEIGGFVGRVTGSVLEMTACWFDGTIDIESNTAQVYAGGLIGYAFNQNAVIDTCLYTGDISIDYTSSVTSSPNARSGGFCGAENGKYAYAMITNSISAGTLKGTISGSATAINNLCTTIGQVRSDSSSCTNVYDMSVVTKVINGESKTFTSKCGGDATSVDTIKSNIDQTYAKEDFFGLGAHMLTTLDFVQDDGETIWAARAGKIPAPAELVSDDLVIRVGKPDTDITDQGSGTESEPYIIDSVEELYGFAILSQTDNFEGKYIKLGSNIDVNPDEKATEWAEGAYPTLPWYYSIAKGNEGYRFSGYFDGNGKTISGIYLNQSRTYLGLFAATESGSLVQNLRLTNSYIKQAGTSGDGYTGSVIADCRGDMNNVYSDAIVVSSLNMAGGLLSRANATTTTVTISNCWFNGIVTSSGQEVGGLVARAVQGTVKIENSLNTGTINSTYTTEGTQHSFVGGICGKVDGRSNLYITECIGAGKITDTNSGRSVRSVVGYVNGAKASDTVTSGSTVYLESVFATRDAYSMALPNAQAQKVETDEEGNETITTYAGVIYGNIKETYETDRLIGYCTEQAVASTLDTSVNDVDYDGDGESTVSPGLDFKSSWVIRTKGVPVPIAFTDVIGADAYVSDLSGLNTTLGLSTFDSTQSSISSTGTTLDCAVNMGLGNYRIMVDCTEDDYSDYINALTSAGFELSNDNSTTNLYSDGVVSAIYTKGDWVINLVRTKNTGNYTSYAYDYMLYITISTAGEESLSPNLKDVAQTENGQNITLSMNEMKNLYGNSFVFQLPNGHFIINDGGYAVDVEKLVTYLKSLAGDNEIVIDAWTISHQHSDHSGILEGLKNRPDLAAKLTVEGVYVQEVNNYIKWLDSTVHYKNTQQEYQGVELLKTSEDKATPIYRYQTGQRYYFDGIYMDVLYSQELIETYRHDFNTSSTVLLFTLRKTGEKIFIGGDANDDNMKNMMSIYGENPYTFANLDVFVALHHGKNTLDTFTTYLVKNTKNDTNATDEDGNAIFKLELTLFPYKKIYERSDDNSTYDRYEYAKEYNEDLISHSNLYYTYRTEDSSETTHGTVVVTFDGNGIDTDNIKLLEALVEEATDDTTSGETE